MIEIKNLNKSFDQLHILKDVSFKVNKGDVIAVLGPSGNGKTTLLRCLDLLEKSDSGILTFDNREYDLKHISKREIKDIQTKTGFVFQNFNLFKNKTVLQNVTLGLTLAKKMKKEDAEKIGVEMLEKVGLKDKASSYPNELSGGQQQRVAIARSLASDPQIIYFDEPTSALDPELINEVLTIIKDLALEKRTMLIVTHEISFAKNVANRIIFLDDGKIIVDEKTNDFFEGMNNERVKSFLQAINER